MPAHLAIIAIAGVLGFAVTRIGAVTPVPPTYAGLLAEVLTDAPDPVLGEAANDYPLTHALVLMAATVKGDQQTASAMVDRLRSSQTERGWGMPWEFDAFADGSVNPPTTAYALVTAMVLDALVAARAIEEADRDIAEYWSSRLSSYSDQPTDDVWVPSSAAMIAAAVSQFGFDEEAGEVFARLAEARFRWPYSERQAVANDLQSYVYILWAGEIARSHGVHVPWEPEAAVESLGRYGEVYPTDIALTPDMENRSDSPLEVSGAGIALAYQVRYGSTGTWRDRTLAAIEDARVTPRYAAHALLGIALWEEQGRRPASSGLGRPGIGLGVSAAVAGS
jgi:hypothetical protein